MSNGYTVLIGSRAMAIWLPKTAQLTEKTDHDYLSWGPVYDVLGGDVCHDDRFGQWDWGRVATLDELYTLKLSHSFWQIGGSDVNWNKHAYHQMVLADAGARFIRPLYDILRPVWKAAHGRREVNLRQTKDQFFKDNVYRWYDHDSLHMSVARDERPLYERVLKPGSEVDCSWTLFNALTLNDQIQMVREEIYVTALERILVPAWLAGRSPSPSRAYWWALRRCITSLFKNEWALYLSLNLGTLRAPDTDYVALHKSKSHHLIINGM